MSVDRSLWPDSLARRSRPRAVTQSQDLTRRALQQLGSRTKAPGGVSKAGSPSGQQQRGKPYTQFYQEIISTDWQLVQPPPRQALFSTPQAHAASTSALRAKLCPALDTTKDWTRVQRKLLPKYLLVLDAVTAVHLLQCLARLQPPTVNASQQDSCTSQQATDFGLDEEAEVLPQVPTGRQQQQLVQPRQQLTEGEQPPQYSQGPSLDQLAQLPTSIHAALAGPNPGVWPVLTLSQAQLAAADAAAVAAGFTSAAAARADFELMLSAVYTVLCAKLDRWPVSVLVKLLGCAGQMQLRHEGFLQAWLQVSQPQLSQQAAPVLFACLEALSRLHVRPTQHWWQDWEQAMQGQLPLLSLTQLAVLQLHLSLLQLQPGAHWMLKYQAAVLNKVTSSNSSSSSTLTAGDVASSALEGVPNVEGSVGLAAETAVGGTHSSTGAGLRGGGQDASKQGSAVAQEAAAASTAANAQWILTTAQADAMCTVLCTRQSLSVPPPKAWLSELLQLCTGACQQGRLSTAGALQLLTACCCGCCVQLQGTAEAQAACLGLLQQRMSKLPTPAGVAVLFACLQSGCVGQLRGGFAEALALRLTDLLSELPTALLLQVPRVLMEAGQRGPDERLLAAYALVTQTRLVELEWEAIKGLLAGCIEAGWTDMPTTWCFQVQQQLDLWAQGGELGPVSSGAPGAWSQYSLGGSNLSTKGLLELMERIQRRIE